MKVHELIEQLKLEDPEANVVVVPACSRYRSLRVLEESPGSFYDTIEVAGKDSSGRGMPRVVLIAAWL